MNWKEAYEYRECQKPVDDALFVKDEQHYSSFGANLPFSVSVEAPRQSIKTVRIYLESEKTTILIAFMLQSIGTLPRFYE